MPPAAPAVPIRVENVTKRFRNTTALDGVSLEVFAGEIFGVVGPNGAGKTTLIRTILDIIKPDSGTVEVFGHQFGPADRDRLGYLPEERGLYARQPVGAVLEYLAELKGMSRSDARSATSRWLERFDLAGVSARRVEQLSKGNQQKVQLAATLIAEPRVVFLDEPMSGLDPVSARLAYRIIHEYATGGRSVVLSTHQMTLVESLCTRVFMIANGRRVLYGNLRDIRREHSTHTVIVRSTANYASCPLVAEVTPAAGIDLPVHVHLAATATPEQFLHWLVDARATVAHFEEHTTPLEDIFVRKAGEPAVPQ